MKTLLFLFISLFIVLSSSLHSCKSTSEDQDASEEATDTLPTATAILWVDKDKNVYNKQKKKGLSVRTVKAKVNIYPTGRVQLLSFVKPQESHIRRYLQERLEIFRVWQVMLDSGFVKTGEQYVQLRYIPNKVRK